MVKRTQAVATWSRYLGALALLGVGVQHYQQYSAYSYSVIPTVGTLFALNFASATVLACGLAVPARRLGGPAGRLARTLLSLGGIAVAAGSLAALFVSESVGLFGFKEAGYRSTIVLSIALEAATVLLLGVHLVAAALARPPAAALRPARVSDHHAA